MPTGSGVWHLLYRLVHKFIRSVVSSEKDVVVVLTLSTCFVSQICYINNNQATCQFSMDQSQYPSYMQNILQV